MASGSGGAVCTGQAVLCIPARTALTRAMLSFFVRPLTVGTVSGGSFDVESLPLPVAMLDDVRPVEGWLAGVVDELGLFGTSAAAATPVGASRSGGITPPVGDGRASLLAAQATDAINAKGISRVRGEYLLIKLLRIS